MARQFSIELNETQRPGDGLKFKRSFSKPGIHPLDELEWELRTARITNEKGEVIFEQQDVEVPSRWSQLATNIVASKYFRGAPGTPERERSAKQLIERVAGTIADWSRRDGYFASEEDVEAFYSDLVFLLVNQYAAFNSPVWFNVGVERRPQASACFINSVEDNMESILNLAKTEGMLFKYGSGTGTNFSILRGSKERLSTGGYASGPVSFMKGYDAFAGVIKSGGRTRRAAKMVILDIDHPDIVDFIWCKAREEEKAWKLVELGYDSSIDGEAYGSVFFQNANHSVRVTDEFMEAVLRDGDWETRARTTGEVMGRYKARDLLRQIAEAAWRCGDPGLQYDTTINDWHTCPNSGRIAASNPCVTGDTLVATLEGYRPIKDLVGKQVDIINSSGVQKAIAVFPTGVKQVYRLKTRSGYSLRLTGDHKVWTENRGYVSAVELKPRDRLKLCAAGFGSLHLDPEVAFLIGAAIGDGCITKLLDGTPELFITMSLQDESGVLGRIVATINRLKEKINDKRSARSISALAVGTTIRAGTKSIVDLVSRYAVLDRGSENKAFKQAVFELDGDSLAALLCGLFTADGTVANYGEKSQYVALDSASLGLLKQVQLLLLQFGIKSKIYENRRGDDQVFSSLPDAKRPLKDYPIKQVHSLRVSRSSRVLFEKYIGFHPDSPKALALRELNDSVSTYREDLTDEFAELIPDGTEQVFDLTEPIASQFSANGILVHNCSEYMFLDDTACNLASLNLMKFLDDEGSFQIEAFRRAVDTMILAQEIIVDRASYPTEKIARNSHIFRTLGLGYANLGALLMSRGLPYDSDAGRAYAAAITALMCGEAYRQSALVAEKKGPFAGFEPNREPMLRVIEKHRHHVGLIEAEHVPADLYAAAKAVWDEAAELGRQFGYRNAQVTLLAPTGTIGFMMDCDTTGIEPDIALVKYKNLVGGGVLKIVNSSVPRALRFLGYSQRQIEDILRYIEENETIEGAPHIKDEHLPVFDCAFRPARGARFIHYMGHIKMMAATQPFLSGAISKTVNMPNSATVEDIMEVYMDGWRMGLKALAIYRDGSKRVQPLVAGKKEAEEVKRESTAAPSPALEPRRRRLPDERRSITHKFSIGGHEGYITVGMYEDGSPGEIFITMSKEGSTLSGLMDAFATMVSVALQYGVPLKVLVDKFSHMRFEPSGYTNNPQIPYAKSLCDYIFRWLGQKFLGQEAKPSSEPRSENSRFELQPSDKEAKPHPVSPTILLEHREREVFATQSDAPPCPDCGALMVRNGACYSCTNCGTTSGCS